MNLQKFRSNYWSCSTASGWIYNQVNVTKPFSATGEEWDQWKRETELNHPIVYWINEELLDNIQDVIYIPYDIFNTFQTWFKYRFIKHTPIIDTHLTKGDFHGADELILHGVFSVLVDFVECEKASMYIWCHPEEPRPWWMKSAITRWGKFRDPILGLKYLDWEVTLGEDSPFQANKAQEIIELYNWWKNIRPTRLDPFDVSGLKAYYDEREKDNNDIWKWLSYKDDEEKNRWKTMSDLQSEIEQQYEDEDTNMLINVIKLRSGLWT